MQVDIMKVIVIQQRNGMDKLIIRTNLPPTVYPYDEPAHFLLDVAKGDGAQYAREVFKIEPEIVPE